MKRQFTEEQIVGILKEGEESIPAKEICRKYGISDCRQDYNEQRPHSANSYLTPAKFASEKRELELTSTSCRRRIYYLAGQRRCVANFKNQQKPEVSLARILWKAAGTKTQDPSHAL